jgi:hypothetical protein
MTIRGAWPASRLESSAPLLRKDRRTRWRDVVPCPQTRRLAVKWMQNALALLVQWWLKCAIYANPKGWGGKYGNGFASRFPDFSVLSLTAHVLAQFTVI